MKSTRVRAKPFTRSFDSQRSAARRVDSLGRDGIDVPQQRTDIGHIHTCGSRRLVLKIGQLLNGWVVQDPSHEFELFFEPHGHHLINGAFNREHSDPSLGTRSEPQAVNPVQALEKASSHEVTIYIDSVVADVMQADSLPESGWVGRRT